jgi:hypothetical protein
MENQMQVVPSRQKVNLLFIGGSNTVMKNGYRAETINALGDHFEIGEVKNLSVGGTTLGMGLWAALNLESPQVYDLVFIEYTVNDYDLTKSSTKFANWQWAFETLLGHLRMHNPRARIHVLIFGRRDKYECLFQQALSKATRELSLRYQAHPIMVDDYVRGLAGDAAAGKRLYADRAHYARPIVTSLIANYIARVVIAEEQRLKAALYLAPPVPLPFPVRHCDHKLFAGLGKTHVFKNSLYDVNAVALEIDGPWREVIIPGGLIQLNYISTRDSARIVVAEEGEAPVAFDTLHKRTDNGEFAFLVRNFLFGWKQPPTRSGKPRKVAMRAVATKAVKDQDFRYVKQFHMLAPKTAERNKVVYLSGALFS